MHYYQHHIGDFIRDAGNLPNDCLGAYMRMLWKYYGDETPLAGEVEDIAFDAATTPEIARQLLRRYFVSTPDGWRHRRCDEEIAKYHEKSEKARQSANARHSGANAMRTQCERNANAVVNDANHKPITINQKKEQKHSVRQAGRFEEFWAEYPRNEGKKKAGEAWARKRLDDQAGAIIADVRRRRAEHRPWAEGFTPHATTYLNGERWNDAIEPKARAGPQPMQMGKQAQGLMALEAMKSGNAMAAGSNFGGAATAGLLGFGSNPGSGAFASDLDGVGRIIDA